MDLWFVFWALIAVYVVTQITFGVAKERKKSERARDIVKKNTERRTLAESSLAAALKFDPARQYIDPLAFALAVDKEMAVFFYGKLDGFGRMETGLEFSGADIVSFSATEGESTTTTKTTGELKTKDGLVRAAAGGAVFGGAGAVVGAVTAKKEQESTSFSKKKRGKTVMRIGMRSNTHPILTFMMAANEADEWAFIINRAFDLAQSHHEE